MRPLKLDGTLWDARDSNAYLRKLDREIEDGLNARDVARGLPKHLSCVRLVGNKYEVVPNWARCKHAGAERHKIMRERWAEFCSEPRDPVVELARFGLKPEPPESSPVQSNIAGFGPAIQAAIADGIRAGVESAMRLAQGNGHALSSAEGLKGTRLGDASPSPPPTRRKRQAKQTAAVEET